MAETPQQRRALVVDDEPLIVEVLSNYLKDEGFLVSSASDGRMALERAQAEPFDVILLDLTLPSMSGVEVFKEIRKISDVPIIMVTARNEDIDKIVGLELGADDYIAKPFNPREIVARVKNVVRRAKGGVTIARVAHEVVRIGDLSVDRTGHEVHLGEKPLKLTPTEFRILDVFIRNVGIALTRTQLLDSINGDSVEVFDRTLDKHIANLRSKIGDHPSRPRYVLTVAGVGYKFLEQ
jgi:DNA-binding response OmpR family regulator